MLDIADSEVVKRVINRRCDPKTGKIYSLLVNPPPPEIAKRVIQREDDSEFAIAHRLRVYHSNLDAIK